MSKQFKRSGEYSSFIDVFTDDGIYCGYIGCVDSKNGYGFVPNEDFSFGPIMLTKITTKLLELNREKNGH